MTPEKKLKLLESALEIQETMRAAVKKAQEEGWRLGVPFTYKINGQNYVELPNGELVLENPLNKPADSDPR